MSSGCDESVPSIEAKVLSFCGPHRRQEQLENEAIEQVVQKIEMQIQMLEQALEQRESRVRRIADQVLAAFAKPHDPG
jgi:glycerate kinase